MISGTLLEPFYIQVSWEGVGRKGERGGKAERDDEAERSGEEERGGEEVRGGTGLLVLPEP